METIKKGLFYNIKGDLFGGVTAGVIALPLALAFGVASGAGAAAGLYGAIIVGLFASLFGGTKPQISGPTGPMTVVLASIVALYPNNFKLVFATIILAGLFQIILGLAKAGKLIKYVPYPVISGFMSGIGVIIILLQLNPLLGLGMQGNPLQSIAEMVKNIHMFDVPTFLIGLITLLIVFFTPRKIAKNIPPALIALISVTALSVYFGLDVKTIGEIPNSLPKLNIPMISFKELLSIIPIALTLCILGSVDSLLTSLVSDSLTKTSHRPNKELIGQGIGNMIAGFFGGIAGAGATMRTVVNIKSGGKTPLSGVIHSLFLILVLLGLGAFAKFIPMAVLAGILIKVGFDIIDYKFINIIKHAPKADLAVMILVFLLTVFYDLIFAVGAGIVLASLLFAASIARQLDVTIDELSDISGNGDGETLEETSKYKIRMVNIDGALFFGSTSRVLTRVDELLGTEYLIINCKKIKSMDISAIFALEDIIYRMHSKKIHVALVLNNRKITKKLLQLGLVKIVKLNNIFYLKEDAIAAVKKIADTARAK